MFNVGAKGKICKYVNVQDIRNGEMIQVPADTACVVTKVNNEHDPRLLLVESDVVHGWVPEFALKTDVVTDKYGHKLYWVPVTEAVDIIANQFIDGNVRAIYVGSYRNLDAPLDNLEAVDGWSKIVRQDLPFDNHDSEILLMMGYLGGGYVGTAYCDTDDLTMGWFKEQISTMLECVTGNSPSEYYFLQLIDKDYKGNEDMEGF